jgi:cytochrome c-type biogenesis protein
MGSLALRQRAQVQPRHRPGPGRARLGRLHRLSCPELSEFFDQAVLLTAFSPEDGGPRWTPNYAVLGYSPWSVRLGAFREATLKPGLTCPPGPGGGFDHCLLALRGVALRHSVVTSATLAKLSWLALAGLVLGGIVVARSIGLAEYMTVRRFTLDAAHFWIGVGILLLAVVLALQHPTKTTTQCTPPALARILWGLILFTGLCGGLVLLRSAGSRHTHPAGLHRLRPTLFSVGILITIAAIGAITAAAGRMMGDVGRYGNYFVALIFFVVGLHLVGVIPLNFSGAGPVGMKRKGLLAAFILGLVFGIALGPCTFAYMAPMLGVTFKLGGHEFPLYAAGLLLAYGIGHCGVIVAAGTSTELVERWLKWNQESKGLAVLKIVCGILVMLGGVWLIYTAP